LTRRGRQYGLHNTAYRPIERGAADDHGRGIAVAGITEFCAVATHPASAGRPSTPKHAGGATELWTHDTRFVKLPGLRLHDPL